MVDLHCPFCGSEVDPEGGISCEEDPATGDALRRFPECVSCGATAPSLEVWNTRTEYPVLPWQHPDLEDYEVLCLYHVNRNGEKIVVTALHSDRSPVIREEGGDGVELWERIRRRARQHRKFSKGSR